jgi:hypothetical protein
MSFLMLRIFGGSIQMLGSIMIEASRQNLLLPSLRFSYAVARKTMQTGLPVRAATPSAVS